MSTLKLLPVLAAAGNPSGTIYLGQEQFLTLAAVVGILGAVLVFLLKHQFSEMVGAIHNSGQELQSVKEELCERILSSHAGLEKELREQIKEINDKTNKRIERLENRTEEDIAGIKEEIGNIKGDFATSFVLREDFFRSMNGVETQVKESSRKIDQVLLLISEKKG